MISKTRKTDDHAVRATVEVAFDESIEATPTTARVVDELTTTQRALLAFLAGVLSSPPTYSNSGTYRALQARGLIEFGENERWRATRLGEAAAQELLP